ncbi:MBL fold metallo-hydrolase [Shimazuella sp. AN120528]|uniref:AVAST type 1 anti-phage system MBL fold metallo-hydrolase Avs1a n=1 Tax=Shimazuella soli TaxID=1892854 RepID=UPI001F0D1406|nr:AVAST type 1 anti-phage system MBL fold metallo-hydrolase Avs1a [Shimazuella soli]MCH5586347.1 MBL fold metallo-hydrolase [Shimazuella soli]
MSNIRIEMFPASYGDSFLVSLGNKIKTHILIDGGLKATYNCFLKTKLEEISRLGEKISLLIVTHIDRDHIEGILELVHDNNKSEDPKIIPIDEIWFNSYRHLQFSKEKAKEINFEEKEILKDIITRGRGYLRKNETNPNRPISAKQGSTLASLIYKGGYNWNNSFHGQAVSVNNNKNVNITPEIKIHILSPNTEKLNKLARLWVRELNRKKYNFTLSDNEIFDDAFEFFMLEQAVTNIEANKEVSSRNRKEILDIKNLANESMQGDLSITNGSSISIIIEYKDKQLLFLGDAHPDIITTNIQEKIREGLSPFFELIKISHHGSKKNTSKDLLELIDAPIYLISTDGKKHNHPDLTALARIVNRENGPIRNLYFNYPTEGSTYMNNEIIKSDLNFNVFISSGVQSTIIEV